MLYNDMHTRQTKNGVYISNHMNFEWLKIRRACEMSFNHFWTNDKVFFAGFADSKFFFQFYDDEISQKNC